MQNLVVRNLPIVLPLAGCGSNFELDFRKQFQFPTQHQQVQSKHFQLQYISKLESLDCLKMDKFPDVQIKNKKGTTLLRRSFRFY